MADGAPIVTKTKPRIAFTGEEFGFGYLATNALVASASRDGVADAGYAAGPKTTNLKEYEIRVRNRDRFEFRNDNVVRLPLRSKEQALLAVKSGQADLAVVPFYSPFTGYDFETLRAMANLFTLVGVELAEAVDQYCLAVYEPQVLDLVQSAHPGSALSELLRHRRTSWGNHETARSLSGSNLVEQAGDNFRAGLTVDQAGQMMLRDRVDMVFCGPDAARRCKSKLDGLRAAGVEVAETLRAVEPHREMARLASKHLSRDRQVNTSFDPTSGRVQYVSTMSGDPQQAAQLYAVVLPFQVAMMSPDFTIIDTDMEDADPVKTRFLVVRQAPDETLYEDAYRTTDAKTRYWMTRLRDVNDDAHNRYVGADCVHDRINGPGVRLMLRFKRSGDAASIADLENYLRNYGVRYAVSRLDEDSERAAPAGIVVDMEFSCADFDGDLAYRGGRWFAKWSVLGLSIIAALAFAAVSLPILAAAPAAFLGSTAVLAALGVVALINFLWLGRFRRTRGSIANGAVKTAFKQWKNRGVTVVAATPFKTPQLPAHGRRRWYSETPKAILADATETWFIRLSRWAPVVLLLMLVGGGAWFAWMSGLLVLPS